MNWQGRKILLGITGSIAAYKSALVVRQLKSKGAEVQVVCTPAQSGVSLVNYRPFIWVETVDRSEFGLFESSLAFQPEHFLTTI